MRQMIIVITKWTEITKTAVKSKLSIWSRILIFFKLRSTPIKEYCYYIDIKIGKNGGDLRKGDTVLLHDRHESAWLCMNNEANVFRIGSWSLIKEMLPYTGPAVIIGNACSELDKNPKPYE